MKKRDLYLFLSFVALFALFAIYQNFSFPTKQLQQITKKALFEKKLQKYVPTYSFHDYIGNIQIPYGYKEEIQRKIAGQSEPVIFDDKKYVKEKIEAMPIYKDIKEFIELAEDNSVDSPCVNNPAETHNNCFTEYSDDSPKSSSLKVKANPFRQTASVSIPGEIQSVMVYDGDRNSINLQFKKELDKDAGIKFELDSQEQSGSINIDVRW